METVTFKGSKDGISMVLDCHVNFEELCQIIVQKLWQSRDFLGEHMTLIINSRDHLLSDGEKLALKVLLQSLGHDILRFTSTAERNLPQEQNSFSEIADEKECVDLSMFEHMESYLSEGRTMLVRKNIRSGQFLEFDGTLIIIGDVNAGAELKASGHILILGTMRGVAHAGCKGDRQAIVYATKLLPIQLRIADLIARAPDDEEMDTTEAEIAQIVDDRLVIDSAFE